MTGTRGAIFAAIMSQLATVPGVDSLEQMPSGDPDGFPALAVYDGGHSIVEGEASRTRYALSVTIEGYVQASGGAAAHAALNALYEGAKAALIVEPPLGGLAETIDEGDFRTDVAELASERRLGFAFDLTIQFATARSGAA